MGRSGLRGGAGFGEGRGERNGKTAEVGGGPAPRRGPECSAEAASGLRELPHCRGGTQPDRES